MNHRYKSYLLAVEKYRQENPSVREGQAYMNVLAKWDEGLYDEVLADYINLDPYYNDLKVETFKDYLERNMCEYSSMCPHTAIKHDCSMCKNGAWKNK